MSQYAVMPLIDYADTCGAIRARITDQSIIKSSEMPMKITEVYANGRDEGYNQGWDIGYGSGFDEGMSRSDVRYEEGLTEGKDEVYTQIEPINAQLENTLYGEDIDVAGTVVDALGQNVNQANSDFVAIKGKIVEKGVEVAEGTRTADYADKVGEVYEAGRKSQYDEFWDAYQENGNRTSYQYAFCGRGWNDETFKPKYNIILGAGYSGTTMFWECYVSNLAEALEKQGVILDTTNCGFWTKMFQNAKIKRIPELNCTHATDYGDSLIHLFTNCEVETIDKMIVTEALKYTNTFQGCTQLKDIVFEGIIGQDIDFQWSTKLSKASWISIIDALSSTVTGKSITGSLESVQRAFETSAGAMDGDTSAEWLNLIALKSNWTINLV